MSEAARYRAKPVEIEAIKYTGDVEAVRRWLTEDERKRVSIEFTGAQEIVYLTIHTIEGPMECPPSWWVIRGTEGELYPCKDSVFQRKYEPA